MTTIEQNSLETLRGMREGLVARLTAFRARVRGRMVMEGAAVFVAEVVGASLASFVLDHTFRLGAAARGVMLLVMVVGLGYEFWKRVAEPLRMKVGLVALAGAAGRSGVEVAARVASVLELPGLLEARDPPSPRMVERAVLQCHKALEGVDFDGALDDVRRRKMLGLMAGALVVAALVAGIFPAKAGLWARRLFLFSAEPWPQNTYLEVADMKNGRIAVPRGEAYALRVHSRAGSVSPDRINLTIHSTDKTTVLMKEFGKNDFRHEFAVVDRPLTLDLSGGDDEVGPVVLDPVDRPRIVGLELLSQHPLDKAGQKHQFGGGDSDLNFLVKTRLALTVTSNVALRELRLKPASVRPAAGDVRRVDDTHFVISWEQVAPARFEMELVAAESGLVSLPSAVSIGLKVDQVPRVTLAYTGVHPRITPLARIPVTIEARDDFGVKEVALALRDETPDINDAAKLIPHDSTAALFPEDAGTQPATQTAATQTGVLEKDWQGRHFVDVGAMKLPAGALVSITADATDACYTGAQTGHSRTVTFRLVPAEELFREILLRQQGERMKYRKQQEEAEKIRDGLRVVTTAKDAADLARRHRNLQRETLRIESVLTEALTEIKLNGLGSPESHTLMEHNVLEPMAALEKELVSPQTQALDTLFPPGAEADPAAVAAAAEREDQVAIRMKGILKQMAQWDSFVDVLNQLDEIIKLETQVKDQSDKIQKRDTEGLFDDK